MYQLWLDDLFPKARFLDALAQVEKLGHKKQIQTMRLSWINESKTDYLSTNNGSRDKNPASHHEISETTITRPFEDDLSINQKNIDNIAQDDLYEATPHPVSSRDTNSLSPSKSSTLNPTLLLEENEDQVPEDELDILMAEGEELPKSAQADIQMASSTSRDQNICFDDDEEAMHEMDLEW